MAKKAVPEGEINLNAVIRELKSTQSRLKALRGTLSPISEIELNLKIGSLDSLIHHCEFLCPVKSAKAKALIFRPK